MKAIASAALLALVTAMPATHAVAGPFGLSWGSAEQDITAIGVNLTKHTQVEGITSYATSRLPEGTSNARAYAMMFDEELGLQRATLVSDTITNDLVGEEGKQRYELFKMSLAQQYGAPVGEFEYSGKAFPILPSEFYPCLALRDCGVWNSVFAGETPGERIVLSLHGIAPGDGYISIAYEGPHWASVSQRLMGKVPRY